MNWRKLELTDEMLGTLVLIKGRNKNNNREFYALGHIEKFSKGYCLAWSIVDSGSHRPTIREFNTDLCEYYYINIDEIK